MKLLLIMTLFCLAIVAEEAAEILHLQNGDRISVTIQSFNTEDDVIVAKNEQIGEIKIAWKDVKLIESRRILYFRMENDNIVAGKPSIENNQQILASPMLGKLTLRREQIVLVATNQEEVNPDYVDIKKKYEDSKEALRKATEIGEIWSGYLEAHFSGNEGNKNDRSFSGIANLERKAEFDRFVAHIDIRYTEANREKTTSQIDGYLKEDIDINSWLYLWGQLSGKWDEINGIDLRFRAEIGFGLHILKPGTAEVFEKDEISLRWEVGAQYTNIDYDTSEDTHTAGIVTRILYRHMFNPPGVLEGSKPWTLEITGEYYQSFVEPQNRVNAKTTDDYSLKGIVSLTIPVTDILAFSARIWDEYSNITDDPDNKSNDFYWDFGIRISI